MNVLSLFSGIGGLELGLERAGMTVVGQVELDPFCRRVLSKHWPEVPRHDDVRTAVEWWESEPRPPVHVVTAGFPCQPVSSAGKRLAQDDPRWLWPAVIPILRALRPRYALLENVPGLFNRGFGDVLRDLAQLGFDAEWTVLSACAVGAPHSRERVFIVANADGDGWHWRWISAQASRANVASAGHLEAPFWRLEDQPTVARVVDGIPDRMDRIKALGNAVVPQVAEHIGRLIMSADRERVAA